MTGDRRQFLAAGATAGFYATKLRQTRAASEDAEKFTWFCARVPYDVPNGRHVKKLAGETPLKFFQNAWANKDSKAALGIQSYGSYHIFGDPDLTASPPADDQALANAIEKNCYCTSIETQHGQLEYLSDDDELDMSYYFFDSEFAKNNPDRVKFLLHQGWLPTEIKSNKDSAPATHILSRMPTQTCDSNNWDYFKIEGTRLNEIGKAFETMQANRYSDSATMEKFLESQAKDQSWALTIAKFVDAEGSFKDNRSEFQCTPHLCELNLHSHNYGKSAVFEQFIVFDDLWAASHPDMFQSMLRFKKEKLLFVD